MSVSRAQFLRSFGASMAGAVAGTGIASAAGLLAGRIAAITPAVPAANGATAAPVDFIRSGDGSGRRIALSFDDGPTPGVTEVVLDELGKRDIRSTFFMIGKRVVEAPELARRVVAEGHEVGNHTFNHLKLNALPDQQVDAEIQKAQDTIGEVLNHRAAWLRPPYGAFRRDQMPIPAAKGLGVVFWSVDPRDWSQPGEARIVETILAETKPGSIILCHELHRQTADGIGRAVDGLLEKGYEFVTISTLLGRALAAA